MRVRERTVVIAAHPGQRRRIIARRFFRSRFLRNESGKKRISGQQPAGADRHAVQKIPSRDGAMHAQLLVSLRLTHAKNPLALTAHLFSRPQKLLRMRTDESNIRAPQNTRRIGCQSPFQVAYAGSLFPCSQPLPPSRSQFQATCKRNPTRRSSKPSAISRTSSSTTTKPNGATRKNLSPFSKRTTTPYSKKRSSWAASSKSSLKFPATTPRKTAAGIFAPPSSSKTHK